MRNRKILSILAVVLVCAALLAACNRGGNVTTGPSGNVDNTTNGSTTGTDGTTAPSVGETTQPGETTVPNETTVPGATEETTAPSVTEPPVTTQPPVTTDPPATTAPQGGNENNEIKYTVTVLDGDGKPVKNLIVELSNGKIASTNSSGVASFTLPKGNYTVTFKDRSGKADYSDVVEQLTASKTSITVTLLATLTTPDGTFKAPALSDGDYIDHDYFAIGEGTVKVNIEKNMKTYLIFTPTRSGIYRISVSGNTQIVLGNYGGPAYVLANSVSDVVNGAFEVDVKRSYIGATEETTTKYVIGVHAANKGEGVCTITVKRVGDSIPTAADFPWEAAKADSKYLVKYDAPVGTALKDIDINDGSVTIVKDAEGYYHYGTAEGPYVMIRIDSETEYLASFVDICSTSPLGVHYYDANGNFLRKVQYNDMVAEYATVCDANGVCRLNDQLIEMVKEVGTYMGWWNPDSPNFRFADYPYHKDTVWMFAFCYYA